MLDPKTLLTRGAVVCALALAAPLTVYAQDAAPAATAEEGEAQGPKSPAELRDHLQGISERIAELTANVDTALTDENSARQIYDEQVSIIRDVMEQISAEGDFGGQLQEVQRRAEANRALVADHPNPAMRAIGPRFTAQIEEAVEIRVATRDERTRGFAAIRALEDEKEVAVMLARADALDVAIDQAKQRLDQVRELADAAVALAARVEDLSGGASD